MAETLLQRAFRKAVTYGGFFPSECMSPEHYQIYLEVAPPAELERDIISAETMRAMLRAGAIPHPKQ